MWLNVRLREQVVIAVVMLAALPSTASAYLDPGAGSMFIQGLVATLAAAGYALRVYWSRIHAWFGRQPGPGLPNESDGQPKP